MIFKIKTSRKLDAQIQDRLLQRLKCEWGDKYAYRTWRPSLFSYLLKGGRPWGYLVHDGKVYPIWKPTSDFQEIDYKSLCKLTRSDIHPSAADLLRRYILKEL